MKNTRKLNFGKDIKSNVRSLQDLYDLGYIKPNAKCGEMDVSMIQSPYFTKRLKELVVNENTPIGTKVWTARNYYNGKRKSLSVIKTHREPSNSDLKPYAIVYSLEDKCAIPCFYDQLCIAPEKNQVSNNNEKTISKSKIITKTNKPEKQPLKEVKPKAKVKVEEVKKSFKIKRKTNVRNKKRKANTKTKGR